MRGSTLLRYSTVSALVICCWCRETKNVLRRTRSSSSVWMVRAGGGAQSPLSPWAKSPLTARFAPTKSNPLQDSHRSSSSTKTAASQEEAEEDRIAAKEQMEAFLTRDTRNSFIARVYAILAGQLLVTAASICLFGTNPELASWMHRPGLGAAVPIASLIMSTVAWIIMCVSTEARRASPVKWQILALFTLGEALSVGFVSSFYQFRSVVSAMMATALATTGISLYTVYNKNSKFDLSQWGATLSSFGLIFVVYGLIQILQMVGVLPAGFLPYNDMAYGLIGATLFSCYLAYHTKLIVAGKNSKYQMNEKDYIFGAMTLYNDIINLFIYLLKAIGEDRKK